MTLALIDCPTGLAGNMLLAALLDLGLPEAVLHEPLAALGLQGAYRLEIEERRSAGLRGLHLAVIGLEAEPPARQWSALRRLLEQAPLAEPLRRRVLAVFTLLAEAEAAVHGHPPERVHFHEVGAIDALVDVVGVCAGLLHFGVDRLICLPPPAGHGQVATAHGLLPVPVPAVLEIARRCRVPLASSEGLPAVELTTPTGLALAAGWARPSLCRRPTGPCRWVWGSAAAGSIAPTCCGWCWRSPSRPLRPWVRLWPVSSPPNRCWCSRPRSMTPRRRIWPICWRPCAALAPSRPSASR